MKTESPNEFQKLDAFMQQHRPVKAAPGRAPALPQAINWKWPLAAGLSCVLTIAILGTLQYQESGLNDEAVVLVDTLEMAEEDFELDPEEFTDLVAVVE